MTHLNIDKNKLFTFPPEVSIKMKEDTNIHLYGSFLNKLTVQSQQWKQNKEWNLFKVDSKDIKTTSLIWTDCTQCFIVTITDFEQVNAGWWPEH